MKIDDPKQQVTVEATCFVKFGKSMRQALTQGHFQQESQND
jgi:hypothetical protein